MITRAQAEALLTLAESLEACEQLDVDIYVAVLSGVTIHPSMTCSKNVNLEGGYLTGMSVRLAVNTMIPKQEDHHD